MSNRTILVSILVVSAMCWSVVAAPPKVLVTPATPLNLPGVVPEKAEDKSVDGEVDCNSPAHWDGDTLYMFFSAGHPFRSEGPDLAHLSRPSVRVTFDNEKEWREGPKGDQGGRWIEATHKAASGKLYGWYHNEPPEACGTRGVTIPRIGQAVSTDNGLTWHDQGIILEAPADSLNCDSVNRYFRGGNGDFCVVIDPQAQFIYFVMSTYHKNLIEQGVAVAYMKYSDLSEPRGKVLKWHRGQWNEPGLGGHVTPVVFARHDWHKPDVDAYWGPSIHWNTYLNQWVMLLNRAVDKDWKQEGIYISYNPNIADPNGWSEPAKILDGKDLPKSKWYPQIVGMNKAGKETDKLTGKTARLFVAGQGLWFVEFDRGGAVATRPATSTQPASSPSK